MIHVSFPTSEAYQAQIKNKKWVRKENISQIRTWEMPPLLKTKHKSFDIYPGCHPPPTLSNQETLKMLHTHAKFFDSDKHSTSCLFWIQKKLKSASKQVLFITHQTPLGWDCPFYKICFIGHFFLAASSWAISFFLKKSLFPLNQNRITARCKWTILLWIVFPLFVASREYKSNSLRQKYCFYVFLFLGFKTIM